MKGGKCGIAVGKGVGSSKTMMEEEGENMHVLEG